MHSYSAKLKHVRSYKALSPKVLKNEQFQSWFHQSWSSRSIEVGCGAGLHPIQIAKQNPNNAHLALERTQNKFHSFKQRIKTHNLNNLMGLNEEALLWLPVHIEKNTVDSFYFLYPNPYPKEKQSNKRWHRSPFFEFVLKSLKPGGLIHFATNESWYAEECFHYCKEFWKLKDTKCELITDPMDFKPRTHFEKKYLLNGQTCYDLVFEKP